MTRISRADRVALAAIIFLSVAIFIVPIVRGEVFVFRDHLSYFLPLRFHTASELRNGHLPLWNPYNACGEPWLANPQTGVFYAPQWLFVILPFATAYTSFLLLHLAILGLGSYALFRRASRPGAALVGAIALMVCGPTLSLLDVANNLTTLAWMPLVLALALERRAGRKLPHAIDAIALTLMFLGGEPFLCFFAACCYAAIVRRWRDIALTGAIAFALSSVQLLPFIEWLRGSERVGFLGWNYEDVVSTSTWLRVILPPHVSREGEPLLIQQYIALPYAGMFIPALAAIGAVSAVRRRERRALWLVLLIVCAVLASTPLLSGFQVRYPSRMIAVAMIAVAALAVAGWEVIAAQRWWVDAIVAIVIVVELIPRATPLLHTVAATEISDALDPSIGRAAQILRLPVGQSAMTDPPAWLFGYENLYARRFDTGSASPVVPLAYLKLYQAATLQQRVDVMNLLSARYIFCDRPLPLPAIARVRAVTVYRNDGALPMARLLSGSRVYPAAIPRIDHDSVAVSIDAPSEGLLMIAQRDAPGWRVSVDGERAAKQTAFSVFRAVRITRGKHRVEWRYRPISLIAGVLLSIAGIVACFVSIKRLRVHEPTHVDVRDEPDRDHEHHRR